MPTNIARLLIWNKAGVFPLVFYAGSGEGYQAGRGRRDSFFER
jgi:hypothetical protein